MDNIDQIESILYDFANKTWGGHLEMTDEIKELIVETRNEILEVFS